MTNRSLTVSSWTSRVAVEMGKIGVFWIGLYWLGYLQLDFRWTTLALGTLGLLYIWWHRKHPEIHGTTENAFLEQLPQWVLDPDTERAEWTNAVFRQLWPHLEKFLKQTLSAIEKDPQLQKRLKGYHISCLKFPKVSLGTVPPKLSGIKFHKISRHDEIILDVSVQYNGNLYIELEATVDNLPSVIPPTKASIRNVAFSGSMRFHFRPLLRDLPFVGGVTVAFLDPPTFDFDLGGIANYLDLPGMNFLLRHVIQDQLEQTIVMPNSITISLLSSSNPNSLALNTSEDFLASTVPSGVLSFHLIEAKGLKNKDNALFLQGRSDPYGKIRILSDGVAHNFKSEVIPDNLNPTWKLMIDMPVDDPDSLDDIQLEIWDEDKGSKDDFLGSCSVPTTVIRTAMTRGMSQDVWKNLQNISKGSVHVEVGWAELKLNAPPTQDDLHKGVLTVVIDSCSNLLGDRTGLKLPNPKVKMELCGIFQETEVKVGTVSPIFSHRMNFLVRNPTSDTLKVSVLDAKRDETVLGHIRINISDLLDENNFSVSRRIYTLGSKTVKGSKSPRIILSLIYRYIHRPKGSSFGSHSSIMDLPKIMTKPKAQNEGQKEDELRQGNNVRPVDGMSGKDSTKPWLYIDDETSSTNSAENIQPQVPMEPVKEKANNKKSVASRRSNPMPVSNSFDVMPDLRPMIQMSLKYNQRNTTLSIVIHKLKNLEESDHTALPSPYVKLYLIENVAMGCNRRVAFSKRKTSIHRHKVNPVFEETVEYFALPQDLRTRRLEVSVCSTKHLLARTSVVGRCLVSFYKVLHAVHHQKRSEVTVTEWYVLHNSGRNQGHARAVGTIPRSKSGSESVRISRKLASRGSRTSLPDTVG